MHVAYKGTPIRPSDDFWVENLQVLKVVGLQPNKFYLARLSFIFEGRKYFCREVKAKKSLEY